MMVTLVLFCIALQARAQEKVDSDWIQNTDGSWYNQKTGETDPSSSKDASTTDTSTSKDYSTTDTSTSKDASTQGGSTSKDASTQGGSTSSGGSVSTLGCRSRNTSGCRKILCLHGGGGTGRGFQQQVTALANAAPDYEFVFVTSRDNGLWLRDPPSKSAGTSDPNWDLTSRTLLDAVSQSHGPFYGIMGYSQGGAMTVAYLASVPEGTFQVALVFCGYIPTTHHGVSARITSRSLLRTPAFFLYRGK